MENDDDDDARVYVCKGTTMNENHASREVKQPFKKSNRAKLLCRAHTQLKNIFFVEKKQEEN